MSDPTVARGAPLRVAAIQMEHGATLEGNLETARRLTAKAADRGARIVVLPEYFFATFDRRNEGVAAAVRAFLAATSRDLGIALAGNVVEAAAGEPRNVGLLFDRGREALAQVKMHPMPREVEFGIRPGERFGTATVGGLPVGVLVCADILYPEAARILSLRGARLLLNPVMSPDNAVDPTKDAREAVFVARAYDAGAFVVKAGGFREGEPRIVGRSLVTAPWGTLAKYRDEYAEEVLMADLDLAQLDAFRAHQAQFPPRRPEAYGDLVGRGETL